LILLRCDRSRSRVGSQVFFALALGVLAGCSGSEDAVPLLQVTEEDGVTVVTNSPDIPTGHPVFTFEPVLRLREDPSDPESLLVQPSFQFEIGENGRYYVPDRRQGHIAVYDGEGVFLERIGRSGDGPGEFRSLTLQRISGDTISVFDFHNQRTTLLDLEGELIEVMRPAGTGLVIGYDYGPGGTLLVKRVQADSDDDVDYIAMSMTILSAETDTVGHISTASVAASMLSRVEVSPGSFSTLSMDIPYGGYPQVVHVPERGILASDGDSPDLVWYDHRARKRMIIRTGLSSHPITAAVRAGYEERVRQRRLERARERGTTPQPVPDYPYPEVSGFFSWVTVDDAGWIWLEDVWRGNEEPGKPTTTFHVVDPEGRYWGTVEMPQSRFSFARGRLHCLVEDPDTGARVPTVFRVVPAVEGVSYPQQ